MAKKTDKSENKDDIKAYANKMLENLNKKFGKKAYYNLGRDDDPAKIERWYSTHLFTLNAILSGDVNGGFPGGRVVEISGPESIGKSHLCYQIARWVQENGGFSLYIDTERATDVKHLTRLGIDINDPCFIYAPADSIEEAFEKSEEFLKELAPMAKKIPIAIFYDSIGGVGSKLERDMKFDDVQRPGLNAKQITFGLRKITSAISEMGALLCIINQEYDIIGAGMFDKKQETKGGKFIKYNTAHRVGLKVVTQVYPEDLDKQQALAKGYSPCGIRVRARTNKNKVAEPYRSVEFDIVFGVGVKEHITIWDMFEKAKEVKVNGKIFQFSGGAWKTIEILDEKSGELLETVKFRKKDIEQTLMQERLNDITRPCITFLMNNVMRRDNKEANEYDPTVDGSSYNAEEEENVEIESAMKDID